jgi:hypothetical protein
VLVINSKVYQAPQQVFLGRSQLTMSEFQVISEQQLYEQEVAAYKKQLAATEKASKTSSVCSNVVAAMMEAEANDGFLIKEGVTKPNQFHSAKGGGGGDGCCVMS